MHSEEKVAVPPSDDYVEEPKSFFYYDVSNPFKCLLLQFAYFLLIPFLGFKELFLIAKDSMVRDNKRLIKHFD